MSDTNPKEVLGVFYNRQDSFLWGCIAFFQPVHGIKSVPSYHQSSPFILGEYLGPEELIVFGSVSRSLEDTQGLLDSIDRLVADLDAKLATEETKASAMQREYGRVTAVPNGYRDSRAYREYKQNLASTLILLAVQARNLFQLIPRLGRKCRIKLSDRDGGDLGSVAIRDLFDQFIHNRYFVLDGEHVLDLFPDKPRPNAPISRKFMGYRFNWVEYIEAIKSAIRDVKIRDLTGLLRGSLERLTLKTNYGDIVSLIQNLLSFEQLFSQRISDGRYEHILSLWFDAEIKTMLEAINPSHTPTVNVMILFRSPTITINPILSEKTFKVHVDCRLLMHDLAGRMLRGDTEFRKLEINIPYGKLLDLVSRHFGEDPLLRFRP